MSNRFTETTLRLFLLLMVTFITGCATNFEPVPLPANHPASAQAQEAPRRVSTRLIGKDAITQKTIAQLERKDAPAPDSMSGGMSHDMSGMDHSKMPGMDMKKEPARAPAAKPADMDHSKMPGMTMPAAATSESPASPASWTCVMHPEIHADKPGQCPKCGMTLVKKEGGAK